MQTLLFARWCYMAWSYDVHDAASWCGCCLANLRLCASVSARWDCDFSLVSPGSVFPQSQCVQWWYRLTLIPPLCAKAQCGVGGGTLIQVRFYASVCRFLFTFLTVRYSSSEFHTWHLYRCNYFANTSFSQIVDHTWKYSQEGWWAKGCRICKWDGRHQPVFYSIAVIKPQRLHLYYYHVSRIEKHMRLSDCNRRLYVNIFWISANACTLTREIPGNACCKFHISVC